MKRMHATVALMTLTWTLASCGPKVETCLPSGERATVLRKGESEGYRYVTLRRADGEEVTCTGKNTPMILQPGDEIEGSTMEKADATKPPR